MFPNVCVHARESTCTERNGAPRDHLIRYDRSQLSLQYPTRIVSVELTNGPPVQPPGFRRVINDIILPLPVGIHLHSNLLREMPAGGYSWGWGKKDKIVEIDGGFFEQRSLAAIFYLYFGKIREMRGSYRRVYVHRYTITRRLSWKSDTNLVISISIRCKTFTDVSNFYRNIISPIY